MPVISVLHPPGRARKIADRSPGHRARKEELSMATVACEVCADRYRRPVIRVVFTALFSPLVWGWAALAALARLGRPRHCQPRLCLLAGNRPMRGQMARALRGVLDELER